MVALGDELTPKGGPGVQAVIALQGRVPTILVWRGSAQDVGYAGAGVVGQRNRGLRGVQPV